MSRRPLAEHEAMIDCIARRCKAELPGLLHGRIMRSAPVDTHTLGMAETDQYRDLPRGVICRAMNRLWAEVQS